MHVHDRLFIGGVWEKPAGTDTIDVISPHTEEVVGRVPEAPMADIDRRRGLGPRHVRHGDWSLAPPDERIAAVSRFADALRGPA